MSAGAAPAPGSAQLRVLRQAYHLAPRPLRVLWLQHRLARILASYVSRTAYVKVARILEDNHRAAGLPRPSPIEREQLILDAEEVQCVVDSLGRTWRFQGRYTAGRRRSRPPTYLVYMREEG